MAEFVYIARLPEGEAPAEFRIFPRGVVVHEGENVFMVDDEGMAEAVEYFQARGVDLVIDYEHQSEMQIRDTAGAVVRDFRSPDGTAPAAGWIKGLEAREDGLWATAVDWTERARQFLAKREYRYISPVYIAAKGGRLQRLLRAALTNAPGINELRPLVAKDQGADPGNEEEGMTMEELIAKLKELLGLEANASNDDVWSAVNTLFKLAEEAKLKEKAGEAAAAEPAPAAAREVLEALGLGVDATPGQAVARISELRLNGMSSEELAVTVGKLQAESQERAARDLVDSCGTRITPAMREEALKLATLDPELFKAWAAKLPEGVPTGDLHVAKDSPGDAASTYAAGKEIYDQLGVTPEMLAKVKR